MNTKTTPKVTTDPGSLDRPVGHCFTGEIIRMCGCGTNGRPINPCLKVYSDGRKKYAHCHSCGKTWDVKTLRELFLPNVRDDLLGTAGAQDAAKPSILSDSGGGLGRSLR